MSAPDLDAPELQSELKRIFQRRKNLEKPLIAFYGQSSCKQVRVDPVGELQVCSVASEFELRRALPGLHDDTQRIAFLLGWSESNVPVDLAGRFVRHGRIFRIGKSQRLRPHFGDETALLEIDPSLARSKFANLLLSPAFSDFRVKTGAGRITLDLAFEYWLRFHWGVGLESSLGLDTLMAWAAVSGRHDEYRELMARPEAEGVAEELAAFLRSRVSEVAPLIWELWQQGKGQALLEFAVLFEALTEAEGAGPISAVRTASKHQLGLSGEAFEQAWRPLGRTLPAALQTLQSATDKSYVRRFCISAQDHLDSSEQAQLEASPRLPVAWTRRLDALGEVFAQAASHPTSDAATQAAQALRHIERHEYANEPDHTRTLKRAEMATRLLGWLAVGRGPEPTGRHTYAEAEALAHWYAHEGGYVDWARHRARGESESAFGRGVQRLLARVDEIRVQQDRRFARGLAAWLEEGRPRHGMLPIENAVEAFAARFLERNPARRALVLLVDGMAWAQAVAIMQSLGEGSVPWLPVAWNAEVTPESNRFFTPVLASLPSITTISRSAFFAGKPIKPGKEPNTGDNTKLWAQNKALTPFFDGVAAPKLHLRADFRTDGHVAKETTTLIEDTSQRVVAVVVNAIDEQLKADVQAEGPWTADGVEPLRELLASARKAGRAVLLASDHGHVSGQRLQWTQFNSSTGSARWRPRKQDDAIHEFEVAISHEHTWAPKGDGVEGIICLADDLHSYASRSHYGEHGGATLAEVVAPMLMIGCDDLQPESAIEPDRGLETRGFPTPDWWNYEVRVTAGQQEATQQRPAKTKGKRKTSAAELEREGQLPLAPAPEPPPSAPPRPDQTEGVPEVHVSAATKQLLKKLEKSPLFAARTEDPKRRSEAFRALEFLLERGNHASTGAFASHVGIPKFRVRGFISNLSGVLNMDGYEVLSVDATAGLVRLNLEQLKIGFGL